MRRRAGSTTADDTLGEGREESMATGDALGEKQARRPVTRWASRSMATETDD
jgi:hypothetical protein